jgi:hypothetical protein
VDEGEMSLESTFLQRQIDRRLDPKSKSYTWTAYGNARSGYRRKTISPLLKAYLHREIVELMKNKPASWGCLEQSTFKDYYSLWDGKNKFVLLIGWIKGKCRTFLNLAAFIRDWKRIIFLKLNLLWMFLNLAKSRFSYVGPQIWVELVQRNNQTVLGILDQRWHSIKHK